MSETPANQFGISTDLPSLSLTVHPSVSIYFCSALLFSVSCMLPGNNNDKNSGLKSVSGSANSGSVI